VTNSNPALEPGSVPSAAGLEDPDLETSTLGILAASMLYGTTAAAPEEERNAGEVALALDAGHPLRSHESRSSAGLASDDHPMECRADRFPISEESPRSRGKSLVGDSPYSIGSLADLLQVRHPAAAGAPTPWSVLGQKCGRRGAMRRA